MAQSYCLKHQERPATARCSACLKPLCEDCSYVTAEGTFCGDECHQKRLAANVRVERLKEEEAAAAARRKQMALIKTAVYLVVIVGLLVAWPYLPDAVTEPVEKGIAWIKSQFSK